MKTLVRTSAIGRNRFTTVPFSIGETISAARCPLGAMRAVSPRLPPRTAGTLRLPRRDIHVEAPRALALERGADAKDRLVVVGAPDDLDAGRDAVVGDARRHGQHRAAA